MPGLHRSQRPEKRRAHESAAPQRSGTAPSLATIARWSGPNLGAELTIEPRFRGAPVALGGRWGDAEHMCRFLDRESAKRTKLDDPGQFSVEGFEAIECVIQGEDRHLA